MTTEEKQLLLVDLCGRMAYNPIVEYSYKFEDIDKGEKKRVLTGRMIDSYFYNIVLGGTKVTSIKLYLRPMSSMTEGEKEILSGIHWNAFEHHWNYVDFCNKHHLDYRGLIPMGLALEAPEGMYKLSLK